MRFETECSQILWEVWDPIGLNNDQSFMGEYDGYIGRIAAALRDGADEGGIARLLEDVATDRMGLLAAAERHAKAAREIVRLYARMPVNEIPQGN